MVCVELDFDEGVLGISLLDTISSEVIWEKKNWFTPSYRLATDLIVSRAERDNTTTFFSSYSPDGNTLLFGGGEDKIAFDLAFQMGENWRRFPFDLQGSVQSPMRGPTSTILTADQKVRTMEVSAGH
jgi:hypothetical protein